jgi:toxin-antitoxin system PIN domain toxin
VFAHREDSAHHRACYDWLERTLKGDHAFALSELVLSSVVRIITHPKIFMPPTPLNRALLFTSRLLAEEHATVIAPGPRHWELFGGLCRTAAARGNLVTDAYLAALAIESGCELISTDGDFAKFPGLKWRRPF